MDQGWQTVDIDGRRFAVRRVAAAAGPALEVERSPTDRVRLRPWCLDDHLSALDRHAHHDGQAPRLDPDGLAAEILARTSDPPLDAESASELAPPVMVSLPSSPETLSLPSPASMLSLPCLLYTSPSPRD